MQPTIQSTINNHLSMTFILISCLTFFNTASAVLIDFDTDQGGAPYVGLGDSFIANEYNGVIVNDSDPSAGSTFREIILL